MEYLQKANEWVGTKLGNTATLSGAIDIIVVEQEDETFLSSPFYVRFGKFAKLTAKGQNHSTPFIPFGQR